MTSPMRSPALHDTFVLLDGSKRRPLPGVARVTVSMAANLDTQTPPADEKQVTQLTEATAEITVTLTMVSHEEWVAYQSILTLFRRGTKTGPAVFTTAHPEVVARRVKRLYFVSEQGEAYSPSTGYKVSIKFSEKLKEKTATGAVGSTPGAIDAALNIPPSGQAVGGATTEQGAKILAAARRNGPGTAAAKTLNGVNDVSEGGYCSSWQRVVGTEAGLSPALFGGTAIDTEGRFRAAKLSEPWSSAAQSELEPGTTVFYGNDPSGQGHTGTYMGKRADGTPIVLSNNLVTYKARGGLLDAGGRPTGYNVLRQKVDARGEVPLLSLGIPTSVARPPGRGPVIARSGPILPVPQGVPLPANRPSQTVPKPPPNAYKL